MFSCLRRSEADQPSDVELPLLSDDPCIFCKTIIDHGNNVKKVVEKAKNQLKGKFVKKNENRQQEHEFFLQVKDGN